MSYQQAQSPPLIQKRQTYKSMRSISLMILNISLSFFYFGYCIVYLASLDIKTLLKIYSSDVSQGSAKGILNGCIPIGALIGALSSSLFISRLSRKKCLLTGNALAFIAGCFIYVQNFYSLIFFRLIQGFCVGFFSAVAPLIAKQLSPTQISGTLGTFNQLSVTIGVFLGSFFTYILKKITGDETGQQFWFITFGLTQVTLIAQTLILLFVFPYQTPKYLLSVGKQQQARQLIAVIYKQQYIEQILLQKKNDLESSNGVRRHEQTTLQDKYQSSMIQSNKTKITTIVAIFAAAMQQLSGINAVAVYGGDIAANAVTGQLKNLLGSIINFQQVLATLVTGYLLSKYGRRTILLAGVSSISFASALIGIGFFIKGDSDQSTIGTGMIVVGLFLFMGIFGVSLGPVVWLYIPEIVAPKIVPYSTMVNWVSASSVIILFPIITQDVLNNNPGLLFAFFTVWSLGSTFFSYFYVLQTKDKTQKAIKQQYQNLKLC